MFLTDSGLAAIPHLSHGFFLRKGGVSTGLYASLNCGPGSNDEPEQVAENRSRAALALGGEPAQLCTLHQIHGTEVITLTECRSDRPKADAMVTDRKGIILGILTADCVPVLFADRKNGVIGGAHSGWKGTLAGILPRTVAAMRALGATPGSLVAAIGPSIAQASYEVGEGLRAAFLAKDMADSRFFVPAAREGHWRFDLKGRVRASLAEAGVGTINILENDTYMEEDDFFSFRRATHRKEPDYARQLSAILLK